MHDTRPEALRRFKASLTGHALTTSEKAAVLIVLDKCADEMEKLLRLLKDARPLADTESPEGLQWMLDVRAALYVPPNANSAPDWGVACSVPP